MQRLKEARRKKNDSRIFVEHSYFPQTPLHKSANGGHVECVNVLIKYGADVAAETVRTEGVPLNYFDMLTDFHLVCGCGHICSGM